MKSAKSFKKFALACVAATAMSFTMGHAVADEIFSFTFTGAQASGFGTLTATDNADGSFTAISGSGTETVNGTTDALTLMLNPNGAAIAYSPSAAFYFDNQLFPAGNPLTSIGGLLFASATQEINVFSTGANSYLYYQQGGFNEATAFTLVHTGTVPEPTTIMLLGVGLIGFAASRRKLQK